MSFRDQALLNPPFRTKATTSFTENKATIIERIKNKQLHLTGNDNNTRSMEFDTLVVAVGMRADNQLFFEADKKFKNVRRIGDCLNPRNIMGAIWAYEVARRL